MVTLVLENVKKQQVQNKSSTVEEAEVLIEVLLIVMSLIKNQHKFALKMISQNQSHNLSKFKQKMSTLELLEGVHMDFQANELLVTYEDPYLQESYRAY